MKYIILLVLLRLCYAHALLQTYAMQYRICDPTELPKFGEQGQWSCYTVCAVGDLYRSQPCYQQLPLTMSCPGIYRLQVFEVADSQGFFLTSVERCIYPLYSTCTSSQQQTLCNVTSPGCVFYDTFDPARFYNGTCVQPYGVVTANNVFRACTSTELTQACYADEMRCTYDETFDHFLFQCPWTNTLNSGAWNDNNTVPDSITIASQCSDVESETQCISDWRTHVPREPCSRRVVKFHEYKGHEYVYDLSKCNRKPCTAAQQLSVCGDYTSDCWQTCSTPSACTVSTGACNSNRTSPFPARFCTEAERLQTGCVTAAAVVDECRVRCTSTDLQTGCVLESRCLWSQGYPNHYWNSLHLLPNVSYICNYQEHHTWCTNRNDQDPFRQDPYSLCRKICNAQGVCGLRDSNSCTRAACTFEQQQLACVGHATTNNSRCSALTACMAWSVNDTCSVDAYCPSAGYSPSLTATNYSLTYWDSWFSTDSVVQCNATEFAVSCAPFQIMCRRRCPTGEACVLEQKCTLGQISWTSFNPDGSTGDSLVRVCTTGEYHASCAVTLSGCKATCDLSGNNCNITAICPWSFGYIAQPAIDPDPQTCSNSEAISTCGSDYTSPCLKYNCTYIGYTDTHINCVIDPFSCNSRACTATEQLSLCGYYTHECRVKCNADGVCSLFGGPCGAVAQYPARPCNSTELLDSCAAFDEDCRVQCIDANFTWGCFKQNICPWTSGQWIDNQIEPVPYQRGLNFATAIFCGPGWETDSYNNNCELYECINTRRLGRHDCTCHYSTCYCPFRYTTNEFKCSEDEAQILACDAADASVDNVHSVVRYCGRFGRACALFCTGDKHAPACDIVSPCTCLDDFSFAPLHGLACHGYAQRCNTTEWLGCGLYASTCVHSSVNETSHRFTLSEPGDTTCTCLAGITPDTSDLTQCRATKVSNDGSIVRACTLSEARTACGSYATATGCQYHIPTTQVIKTTCQCNSSSVQVYLDSAYESRSVAPTPTCAGPWAVRNCTAGEAAACEVSPPPVCQYNVSLAQGTRLVNRSACFPDHFDYNCSCPVALARQHCGVGYVSCTVLATYNQVDGCYNHRNTTATCVCDPLYANYSALLGYTCANASTTIRNCTSLDYLTFCGLSVGDPDTDRCYVYAANNTLVNGTCSRTLNIRDCNDVEYNFTCPLALEANRSTVFCKTIGDLDVYQAVNASCPFPPPPPAFVAPPLAPPNSTGYPRECTDLEYSAQCSHDMVCENVTSVVDTCFFNLTNATDTFYGIYNATIGNLTANESAQLNVLMSFLSDYAVSQSFLVANNQSELDTIIKPYLVSLNLTICNITASNSTAPNGTAFRVQLNLTCDPRFNLSTLLTPHADAPTNQTCLNQTFTETVCKFVKRRTSLCVARAPNNFSCTCQDGFGPLNPRYLVSASGFIKSDPRDYNLGKCEGVVRDCAAGDETLVFGGRFATSCRISCHENDPLQNCIIFNATCDVLNPSLQALPRSYPYITTANQLSAFFPFNQAQPCGSMGSIFDRAKANNTVITVGSELINVTYELQRHCGDFVDRASFLIFDCNTTHSLCEEQTRYAVYMFECLCSNTSFPGASLPCENQHYTRACNATEDALVPRSSFDEACQRSYQCKLLCYPATATQQELCFRHAPDPCLDTFADHRWCTPQASQAICGARGQSCYGSCQIHSDLNFTVECDPNSLARCICDTFNTSFFTGISGLPCDRDYVVQRLVGRDNITQWCGILAESGTVRCRDVNDSATCYQTDACLCQFDAGDGTPLGYMGFQIGTANGTLALNATNVNNATLNTTSIRRPVFSHCAYIYSVGTLNNGSIPTEQVVTGTSLFRKFAKKLPWLARKDVSVPDTSNLNDTSLVTLANITVVLVDNRAVLTGVPMQAYGFSCDYQQKCGTFTEATLTYCDSAAQRCNITCGCYRGTTTMVGTTTPCSAFVQTCDDDQRARCAILKNVSSVSACLATCDETNTKCEPMIGTCTVSNSVVIPRYVDCTDTEAAKYCASEFTSNSCKRKAVCTTDPPQVDCFVCDCAQRNGYINDPGLRYGHHCTDLSHEYFNCTTAERNTCGLRGVTSCKKRLIYGGRFDDLRGRLQFDDLTWSTLMADWAAGRSNTDLLSGKMGGVLIQECTCLFDLFNARDPRRVILSSFNDTLRCDQDLVAYLTLKGACPFRADTGMPCNGVGACEGGSDPSLEDLPWPNGALRGKGVTFLTHKTRWLTALANGYVWLYSDPTSFKSCTDSWCGGNVLTGRVARNAFPSNRWAASSKYGSLPGVPMMCFTVGATFLKEKCYCDCLLSSGIHWEQGDGTCQLSEFNCFYDKCTKTFPNAYYESEVHHVDFYRDYVMTGTDWDVAMARMASPVFWQGVTRSRVETTIRTVASSIFGGTSQVKVWNNCVLRQRSKSPTNCYVDTPSDNTTSFGPHNKLMSQYDERAGDTRAQVCLPTSESDIEYVYVCQEPAGQDLSQVRKLWNDSNICQVPMYQVTTCGCYARCGTDGCNYGRCGCSGEGTYKTKNGTCQPCAVISTCYPFWWAPTLGRPCGYYEQWKAGDDVALESKLFMGYNDCHGFHPVPGSPEWIPDPLERIGPAIYSNNVFTTFVTDIRDTSWYTRIGRRYPGDGNLYQERLDPAVQLNATNLPANAFYPPRQWISGCISSGHALAKRQNTSVHINECVSYTATYLIQDHSAEFLDSPFQPGVKDGRSDYRIEAQMQPKQWSEMYCYTAKSIDNMFMWHGIDNEDYYTGDADALVSSIGPAFVPVFLNLPNKCTRCLPTYTGDNCDTQQFDSLSNAAWVGLCAARGTCCGIGQTCVVPKDWDGRVGCINGYFDYDLQHCVCDGTGWSTYSAALPDTGAAAYCNFNACARNPLLPVFTREFANGTNPICNNRGTCLGPQGICRCNSTDYGGSLCQLNRFTSCPGGNPNTRVECSGHGTCIMTSLNEHYCQCRNLTGAGGYWDGADCSVPHTPDDETCRNNSGTVREHPSRPGVPYCECPYTCLVNPGAGNACPQANKAYLKGGQYCEYSRCPVANGKICNGQGSCVVNGTNAAGYPAFGCRAPLDINTVCSPLDTQCVMTTAVPLVCKNPVTGRILDYDGCACEQPIRVYCAQSIESPLCTVSDGSPIDQLAACQILTNLANGSVVAACACNSDVTGKEGTYCESSVCGVGSAPCHNGICNAATRTCRCRTVDSAVNGLAEGDHCEIDVTESCGYALVSGGDLYKCAGHGQCVFTPGAVGNYSCACDVGHTGLKCQLSDCLAPCDDRSNCLLPPAGGTQKECICKYPLVWGRNSTYRNLCNIDMCKQQNFRFRPNDEGTGCECIEGGVSFSSGCVQALCPADPVTGDVCGPPNPSTNCAEGDCIVSDCQVSYDYSIGSDGRWKISGNSRRRLLCNRYQKQCDSGTCVCGLGYDQDATTGLCTQICVAQNTLDIVPCMDPVGDPFCIDAFFHKSLSGYDRAFKCRCKPAYTGSKFCETLKCAHGGTVTDDGAACVCPFPWTGDTCLDDLCINGVANFVTNQCDCLFGWTGTRCDQNVCKNGGVPHSFTQSCKCPAKWGGATCDVISCRTNNFWDDALQKCVCPPGYRGDVCDIPNCNNNKIPDASGTCVCEPTAGRVNQYMDPLCTYRWCGPGTRICILGACMCICDSRKGIYLDPVTGNCSIPVCGPHSTFDVNTVECVCDPGYLKNTTIPLKPCVRDCGSYGTFNTITGACVCQPNYFGGNCEYSAVAFLQRIVTRTVTLPNGIVVEPIDEQTELRIALETPAAITQTVLFDPFPDAISYQEKAEDDLRKSMPGYQILDQDLDDLVKLQGGIALATDPTVVVLTNVTIEVATFDNTIGTGAYATSVICVALVTVLGLLQGATYVIAIRFRM